ncbi:MAG: hypothetical protein AAF711_16170 [Planctomycetota bacterium]
MIGQNRGAARRKRRVLVSRLLAKRANVEAHSLRRGVYIELISVAGNFIVLVLVAVLIDVRLAERNQEFLSRSEISKQKQSLLAELATNGQRSFFFCRSYRELEPLLFLAGEDEIFPYEDLKKNQVLMKYTEYVEKYFDGPTLTSICLRISVVFVDHPKVHTLSQRLIALIEEFQEHDYPEEISGYQSWLNSLDDRAELINILYDELLFEVAGNI